MKWNCFVSFIVLIFIVIPSALTAQFIKAEENPVFNGERKFSGGVVLGVNAAQVDGDYLSGYSHWGLKAGVSAFVNFSAQWSYNMELLYSQKGSHSVKTTSNTAVGNYFLKYDISANYVEVPMLIHFAINPKYRLGVGASYNYLVGVTETVEDYSSLVKVDNSVYAFNKHTFDWMLNASMVLTHGLMVNMRYQYSITPIRKFGNIPQGLGFADEKNNLFSFSLQYQF
jgi:hypothetical protein